MFAIAPNKSNQKQQQIKLKQGGGRTNRATSQSCDTESKANLFTYKPRAQRQSPKFYGSPRAAMCERLLGKEVSGVTFGAIRSAQFNRFGAIRPIRLNV